MSFLKAHLKHGSNVPPKKPSCKGNASCQRSQCASTPGPSQQPDQPTVNPPLLDSKGSRRFVSHLWSTCLSESLPWRVIGKYKFKKKRHINVLECHARKTLALRVPQRHRYVVLQDSMVCLGAGAKGRSSSASLNHILIQEMTVLVDDGVGC